MLYAARKRFERLSVWIGMLFSGIPLSPNQWTILSLLPAVAAAYFVAIDQFLNAAVLFIAAAFLDLVDGSVARVTGRASRFGAYLDTVADRYVEALVIFGLLFVKLPDPNFFLPMKAWLFIYFFGAMMTTYAKAAAKEKEIVKEGAELKGGILERAERLLILFAGILLAAINPAFLSIAIVLLAILANISALQRIWIARKMAKPAEARTAKGNKKKK
ncbi:MAG: CDP-alcohol phosphatidyltransferase family protein [Candidatus Diapherotrites archaeon]|nr:CDP-alcohol phosphatidyltransferase family protein [Candidatus Diapherotrites archaeon]